MSYCNTCTVMEKVLEEGWMQTYQSFGGFLVLMMPQQMVDLQNITEVVWALWVQGTQEDPQPKIPSISCLTLTQLTPF